MGDGYSKWEALQPAMLKWWIAAERGLETGQSKLALILDQTTTCAQHFPEGLLMSHMLCRTSFANFFPSIDMARLALTQWTRSAPQNNIDGLAKVGDYYYCGLGVPNGGEKPMGIISWRQIHCHTQ